MRIAPVEARRGLVLRLLGWVFRRQFGRGLTPYDVVFARLPRAVGAQMGMYWGLARLPGIEEGLQLLIQVQVASLNGCGFCVDIARAVGTYRGMTLAKIDAVAEWRDEPVVRRRASGRRSPTSRRRRASGASPMRPSRPCAGISTTGRSSPSRG